METRIEDGTIVVTVVVADGIDMRPSRRALDEYGVRWTLEVSARTQ